MAWYRVKSDPKLARPDVWQHMPRSIGIPDGMRLDHSVTEKIESKKDWKVPQKSLRKIAKYLRKLGYEINPQDKTVDLSIRLSLAWKRSGVHFGKATLDLTHRTADIWVNLNNVRPWWRFEIAARTLLLHEIGHCLGLVVTTTESGHRSPDEYLNHCRYMTCAMTKPGIGPMWAHALGWLLRGPRFCKRCENYLKERLEVSAPRVG